MTVSVWFWIEFYESYVLCVVFFFFQAEDGIRDVAVTGVQTCALPISDTRVPMLTRMHGKRLTAYKKIGFTNPVIGEIPLFPGTEMAAPAMAARAPASPSKPAAVSAAEVRAWAKENGLDVPARGRLRPEIWDQYRAAHLP